MRGEIASIRGLIRLSAVARALSAFLFLLSSLVGLTPRGVAQAYTFSMQSVGAVSDPATVTVTITRAGVLSAVKVGGQGAVGVDFAAGPAGTCTPGMSYPAGQTCTVGVKFSPAYPGLRIGAAVLTASDGTVLGTRLLSGNGLGAIGVFVPAEMTTMAGSFTWLFGGDGLPAAGASIYLPFGIAVDSLGNLFIADYGNNRIRKVTAATGLISTVVGTGTIGGTGDGGLALHATMAGPASVALDGAGNLYVSDSGNDAVRKVDLSTGIISTVAGTIGQQGYSGDGRLATAAKLNTPNGIALDSSGNLYIADSSNNVIRRVDCATGIITTVAGTGTAGFGGDGGQATAALLDAPWSMTPSPSGGFYIADQGNNRIRSVDVHGIISTVVGTGVGDSQGDGGPATAADLDSPANVVIDAAGDLYIADSGNNRVRKVSAGTDLIETVAGPGSSAVGDYGPATSADLSGPYTLALDGLGNLYIGDVFHNRVREIIANQTVSLYSPIRVGRTSGSQPQTFENDGNVTLNISSVLPATQSAIDPASTTCLSGLALAPLSSCVVGASFAPTQLGNPTFGTVLIASDAVNTSGELILEGQSLNQDPTTVSLSASTNLAPAGTTIFFTVTVTSGGVLPTGMVTLLDGGNPVGTGVLMNGVVTISVSSLAGGQHVLTASYPGDTNNTAGESGPVAIVVQYVTAPTTTTLAASVNPVLAGSPVTLTASVALVSAGTGVGTISGPVNFTDNGKLLEAVGVKSGTAGLTLSTLTAGQHTIVATYAGSNSYGTSTSAPLQLTVQPGISKTVLSSGANPAIGGAPLTLSAVVTSTGPTPGGSVTFSDGGTTLGTGTIGTGGVATITVANLTVGSHTLVATYAGDLENNGSSSSALTQTVVIATTSVAVQSSLNPGAQGGAIVFAATVTGNGGIPGGTVQFFDGSILLGTGAVNNMGTASFTSSTLGLGAHSITASYLGDTLDAPSVSSPLLETVQSATSTITFTSSLNPAGFAATVSFSVRVLGTGAQPTGVVTLQDGATVLGVQTLDPNGLATFSYAGLAIGTHTLTAYYAGDTYHTANSARLTQTVLQVTTAVLVASTGTSVAGLPVTWTAAVAGASALPLTGTMQFKDGATPIATLPIDANGNATFSSAGLAVGAHSISALYSGDSQSEPAASNAVAEAVKIATTSMTLGSSANPAFSSTTLTLTAKVAGNGAMPGGSVTFEDGTTLLGVATVSANGIASLSTSTLVPGLHSLSASYSGDANDAPAASGVLSQEVVQQTAVTIGSSANPSLFPNSVTISVAVTGGLPANPATGNVTLTDGGTVVATVALNGAGLASFTLTAPALGAHTLIASYAGDSRYSAANSQTFTQTVTLRPTTTDLKLSATQITAGQPVTLFATVQGAGPNMPTGTVSFVNGAAVLGSATLDASGVAVFTFDPPQGSDQVIAQYLGDTLFASSTSLPGALLVGAPIAFNIVVTPNAISMQSGAHTTLNVAIGVAADFADTLQMGCAGLPASATCTFSQDQVKVSGGTGQTITVVVDTGNPLGAGASASLTAAHGTALACMLPGGVLLGLLLLRGRRRLAPLAVIVILTILGAGLTGCANSLQVNHTPAGSYKFQIVGTGANSGVAQSATVAMTVTQ